MTRGALAGAFIVPMPGAKSRQHLEENVRAADIVLTADDLAEIDRVVPPGVALGTRYPAAEMDRLNRCGAGLSGPCRAKELMPTVLAALMPLEPRAGQHRGAAGPARAAAMSEADPFLEDKR
jgi:hypothetical protein